MKPSGLPFLLLLVGCAKLGSPGQTSLLLSGPMLGVVEPTCVRLWVELEHPASLTIQLATEAGSWKNVAWREGQPWKLSPGHLRGARWIDGLQPATTYRYRLLADGELLPEQAPQHFRPPPLLGTWEDFTLAFGSCAGDWGRDPSQAIFEQVAAQAPALFLWLGDNVYYSLQDQEWESEAKMEQRWRRQRALPALRSLLAASENLATWDDHDFGPDNSDASYPLRLPSLRLFESYWANPAAGGPGEDGVYFSARRGGVEFFFLDTRFDRSPDDAPLDENKQLLSPAQWAWLAEGLRSSTADFKLLISGMQVLSDYHRFESWRLYPRDRERLYSLLTEERIPGVILLSGDRHIGEVLRREQGLPYPLYEFTSSPLAAGIGESTADAQAPERLAGSEITVEHFALLHFRRTPSGPEMLYQAKDAAGNPVGLPVRLLAGDLQPQD